MGKVDSRSQQSALFVTLVGSVKEFEASVLHQVFSPISTDSLCLGAAQMP